jgi:DNA-directed RNA polymerase
MPKSAKKSQSIPFVTPWFTARYPKISKPDTQGKFADGKYKTDGVLDDDEYKATEKKLKEAAKQLWPDVPVDEISLPMKTFYKSKEDKEKGEDDGRGIVLKSQYKPACFDSKKKKLPEGVQLGGGSEIRVASAIFPWSKTEKVKVKDPKTGKITVEEGTEHGVGLRLGDVQVRKLVEFAGSGDGSAFDEVEDGFEFEGNDEAGGEQFDDSADGL